MKFSFRKQMVADKVRHQYCFHKMFIIIVSGFCSPDFFQCNSIKLLDLVCLLCYILGQVAGLGFKPSEIVYL